MFTSPRYRVLSVRARSGSRDTAASSPRLRARARCARETRETKGGRPAEAADPQVRPAAAVALPRIVDPAGRRAFEAERGRAEAKVVKVTEATLTYVAIDLKGRPRPILRD